MTIRWKSPGRLMARSLTALTAVAMLFALTGPAAGSASAAEPRQGAGPCPQSNSLGNFRTDSDVGADFTVSGLTVSYTFSSFTDREPHGGVPGLTDYCVYPSSKPRTTTVEAHGANGALWRTQVGSNNFAFQRPDGNPSNIPLDETSAIDMGTATWTGKLPQSQQLLLHIADPEGCARIYGGTPSTCYVKPGTKPGPICDRGDATIAYNAMPIDVVDCYTAAEAFEATGTNEFGDEVGLAAGTSRTLKTLDVMFASYACQAGSWTSTCASTPGATFTHPITANIYAPDDLTTPIATVTQTVTLPYRPSSDQTNCPDTPSKWYNAAAGKCQNSIGTVVTFDFGSLNKTLPDQVVWTVAFNTSTAGYDPIGSADCSTGPGGCPYDSLNVGTTSLTNAPYAGTDVNPDVIYHSTGSNPLQAASGWTGLRPLGAITTG